MEKTGEVTVGEGRAYEERRRRRGRLEMDLKMLKTVLMIGNERLGYRKKNKSNCLDRIYKIVILIFKAKVSK